MKFFVWKGAFVLLWLLLGIGYIALPDMPVAGRILLYILGAALVYLFTEVLRSERGEVKK